MENGIYRLKKPGLYKTGNSGLCGMCDVYHCIDLNINEVILQE